MDALKDLTTNDNYPKTLLIRNEVGGLVWQVYHVNKYVEAVRLARNAKRKGFECITLEDYDINAEETFPDWRETEGGKKICSKEYIDMNLELELDLEREKLSVNDIKSFLLNHPPFESGVLKKFHFLSEAECAVENAIGNVLKVVLILGEREYKITYNLLETKLKDGDGSAVYYVVDTIVNSKPIKKTNIYSTVYNPKVSDDFVQTLFDALDEKRFFPMWETTATNSDNPDTFTYDLAMLIDWANSEIMSEEDISELTYFYEVKNIAFVEFPWEESVK